MATRKMSKKEYQAWRERTLGGKKNIAAEKAASKMLESLRKVVQKTVAKEARPKKELRLIRRTIADLNKVKIMMYCPNQGSGRH